jgi:hypothetical protein
MKQDPKEVIEVLKRCVDKLNKTHKVVSCTVYGLSSTAQFKEDPKSS